MSEEKKDKVKWRLGKSGLMYFCPNCEYAAHPREVEEWNFCPRCGEQLGVEPVVEPWMEAVSEIREGDRL